MTEHTKNINTLRHRSDTELSAAGVPPETFEDRARFGEMSRVQRDLTESNNG